MKVRSIQVERFKQFEKQEWNFVDPATDRARDLVVLVGGNGSGKTTLLQAIALTLSEAMSPFNQPDFSWPGFVLSRLSTAWGAPLRIELELEFDEGEERIASPSYTVKKGPAKAMLVLRAEDGVLSIQGEEFIGSKALKEEGRSRAATGDVFWYDQERKTSSLLLDTGSQASAEETLDTLRARMSAWRAFHLELELGKRKLRPGQRDYWQAFAEAYQRVFQPRQLKGIEPRDAGPGAGRGESNWIIFHDGKNEYELAELSSGEKAVFPLLFDFMIWQINHSVVLIDELELHLHPPLQQYLVEVLPTLGDKNQLILTTHSNDLLNVIPPSAVYRL